MATRRRVRALRPAVACPRCGTPPAIDIPATERIRWADVEPDRIVMRVRCQASGCPRRYTVPARAFQEAQMP